MANRNREVDGEGRYGEQERERKRENEEVGQRRSEGERPEKGTEIDIGLIIRRFEGNCPIRRLKRGSGIKLLPCIGPTMNGAGCDKG